MLEYTSVYDGVVQDLDDPAGRGRARLLVPAVLGLAVSGWAKPLLGASNSDQASVGDSVWVMFEGGSVNHPVWVSPVTSGEGTVPPHVHDMDDVTGLDTTLAAKVPTTRNLTVGVGLLGGGTLADDRSFAVDFATSGSSSATKAVRADDSRLSNPREPTAHEHTYDDLNGAGQIELPLVMQRRAVGPAAVPTGTDALYFKQDGRLYVMSDNEVERPLLPQPSYEHSNAAFDNVQLSTDGPATQVVPARLYPNSWDNFWSNPVNGVYVDLSADDTVTHEGIGHSFKVVHPTNTGQSLASTQWGVAGGNVVEVSVWVRGTNGPRAFVSLVTSLPTADPSYFQPAGSTAWVETPIVIPSGTWQELKVSMTVPSGHTKCGMHLRSYADTANGGAAGTIWWDDSASIVTTGITEYLSNLSSPALTANVWSANITHNLNAGAVDVTTLLVSTGEEVDLDWKWIDTNNIQLRSDVAFAAGALKILVAGRA